LVVNIVYILGVIGMSGGWDDEELKATVEAYVEMQRNERAGLFFVKVQYYRRLMQKFGRPEKAYELRMQNISYVLSLMGRGWLTGLKPARNIDSAMATQIEKLLGQIEGHRHVPIVAYEILAREQARHKNLARPGGNLKPKSRRMTVTHFERDATVKAWILQQAAGVCECCEKPAGFNGADGMPYLELHYVRQLAEGGADVVSNTVALCPGCHSEIHHGANAPALVAWLYDNVGRLRRD
jgi:5-methylcytosine-specific restriction protein A